MGMQDINHAIEKINEDEETANIEIEDENTKKVFYTIIWYPSGVDFRRLKNEMKSNGIYMDDKKIEQSIKELERKNYIKPVDESRQKYKLRFPDMFDYNEIMRVMYGILHDEDSKEEANSVFRKANTSLWED